MIRWDMETGKAAEVLFDVPPQIACEWNLGLTYFSPDRTSFLALSALGVELFDLGAKEEKRRILRNQRPFWAHWEVVRFSEDGKSIYAYGTAQEKTVSGNKLEMNSYAANWDLTGKVLKEGNGKINEAGSEYFEQLFKDAKFAPEPQDDTSLPIISTDKEIDDPAESGGKLTPITIKSRKDGKVLLEVKLPLQTSRGISISTDQKRVAIPLRDNTVLVCKLP
jgi:hypothetical protein